jgi:hypothetical protein
VTSILLWQKKPTLQVVSYYDNVLPQPFPNSRKQKIVIRQQSEDKLCLDATILNENKSVAIIFCFCAHELEQRSPLFFVGIHIMKTYALWRLAFGGMGWKSIHANCLL